MTKLELSGSVIKSRLGIAFFSQLAMYFNRPTSDMQNNSTSTSSQKKLEDVTFIVQYMDLCQDPFKACVL